MTISKEIREIESHVRQIAVTKEQQIAVISKAQSMTTNDPHMLAVLIIVKRRIAKI